jgi:uncharacterized protein with HEPN domain
MMKRSMYDKSLVIELLDEIDEAIRRIERRFSGITKADDFVRNDDGLDRLDAIGMMLIALGENVRRLDEVTGGALLARHPEIDWPGVKGIRDVLDHDYFNIDAEEVYNIGINDLQPLKQGLSKIREEIDSSGR